MHKVEKNQSFYQWLIPTLSSFISFKTKFSTLVTSKNKTLELLQPSKLFTEIYICKNKMSTPDGQS